MSVSVGSVTQNARVRKVSRGIGQYDGCEVLKVGGAGDKDRDDGA